MNAYSSQLHVVFSKPSPGNSDFLLVKAGEARWTPHSLIDRSSTWTLCQPWIFPFAFHHAINLFAFPFPLQYFVVILLNHSLLPACVPTSFVEITSTCSISLSLVLLCLSYIAVTQGTGADCTDLNVEQLFSLAYRLLGLFLALSLNRNTEGT